MFVGQQQQQQQQQHVTIFEMSVETDVMPSLLFEQRYCCFTFYVPKQQPSKRLENCAMNINFIVA